MMAASFRLAMGRPAGLAQHLGWLLALTPLLPVPLPVSLPVPLPVLLPLPALAATSAKLNPTVYPPPATFRSLQLALLACGRENTVAVCDQVRRQADPLLDHPRLPSACKDVLWNIRQKAVVGAADDFSRRDRIEKLAREVNPICSPLAKPKPNAEGSGPGPGQPGGIRINAPGSR
jgi:hypothetical protein